MLGASNKVLKQEVSFTAAWNLSLFYNSNASYGVSTDVMRVDVVKPYKDNEGAFKNFPIKLIVETI